MNPASPIQPVNVLRVPNKPGEQKRDPRTAEDFRRALQQQKDEKEAKGQGAGDLPESQGGMPGNQQPARPSAPKPMPRGLQPARPSDRRGDEPGLRHVDVFA